MNREEAVKVIENMTFMCDDTDYDVMSDAVSMAIEALEYIEKNKKWIDLLNIFAESCDFDVNKIMWNVQEWIPCSERLPEEEKKTYWVCTDTECQCECRWTNNRFGIGEGEWGWSIFDTPQYTKPIAWMPLPEPYKAESEEA